MSDESASPRDHRRFRERDRTDHTSVRLDTEDRLEAQMVVQTNNGSTFDHASQVGTLARAVPCIRRLKIRQWHPSCAQHITAGRINLYDLETLPVMAVEAPAQHPYGRPGGYDLRISGTGDVVWTRRSGNNCRTHFGTSASRSRRPHTRDSDRRGR